MCPCYMRRNRTLFRGFCVHCSLNRLWKFGVLDSLHDLNFLKWGLGNMLLASRTFDGLWMICTVYLSSFHHPVTAQSWKHFKRRVDVLSSSRSSCTCNSQAAQICVLCHLAECSSVRAKARTRYVCPAASSNRKPNATTGSLAQRP